MKSYQVVLPIFLFALLYSTTMFPAITSGTLVQTPNGFIPVNRLRVGDFVVGYCQDCKILVESRVDKIKKKRVKKFFVIKTSKGDLPVSKHHLFWDCVQNKWFEAASLTRRNRLVSCDFDGDGFIFSQVECHGVKKLKRPVIVYEIGLESTHTFFISKSRILTHNFALTIGGTIAFGLGKITFHGLMIGVPLLALHLFGKRSKSQAHIMFDPFNLPGSPNKKPDDEEEKEQEFEIEDRFAQHIFRNEEGHLPYDTPENRKLLLDLVSDQKNFLVKDIHGTNWYSKTLPNGKQLWATTRGYLIRNGGINNIPKTPNSITGLSRLFPPNSKL